MSSPKKYSRSGKLTKYRFLRELELGYSIKNICRQWGYKSQSTIYTWRRKDKEFDASVAKILKSPMHRERMDALTRPRDSEGNWEDRFFTKLRETKDRVLACDAAEISIIKLLALIDPESDEYSLQFKLKYDEEVMRDSIQIEDEVKKSALIENSIQTQKYLLPFLPGIGEKYDKGPGGRLRQIDAQNNILVISGDGIDGAARFLKDLFGPRKVKEVGERVVPAEDVKRLSAVRTEDGADDGIGGTTPKLAVST